MRMSLTALVRARRLAVLAALAAVLLSGFGPWSTRAHASATGTISGTVFQDLNRNGVQDTGEAAFSGFRMDLLDGAGNWLAATNTDTNGSYSFGSLSDATYSVMVDQQSWMNYWSSWVLTNIPSPSPGYLFPKIPVVLSGSGNANFPLRPIVRSSSEGAPVSTVTTPGGIVINSYDDVVSAQQLQAVLAAGHLFMAEQPLTTVDFDWGTQNVTYANVNGSAGSFSSYSAQVNLAYLGWVNQYDLDMFYEYGHAWSLYYMYIVQQDPTLSSYLSYRGLSGNANLGTCLMWEPVEMIADDYRQLFGSANAASYAQQNYQITPAAQVPGLANFLENTFTQPPSTQALSTQPAPLVASITPASGPAAGGTTVTVNGTNFSGSGWAVSAVTFGGVAAQSYTVDSASQLTAVAPPGTGQADVRVTTKADSNGTLITTPVTTADVYSWVPVPTATSLSPASGSKRGGTTVTIYGSGFSGPGVTVTKVLFGTSLATNVKVVSNSQLTVTSPSGSVGSVFVTVSTQGGTSTTSSSTVYTYTRK